MYISVLHWNQMKINQKHQSLKFCQHFALTERTQPQAGIEQGAGRIFGCKGEEVTRGREKCIMRSIIYPISSMMKAMMLYGWGM
jgi:hypothetical protein